MAGEIATLNTMDLAAKVQERVRGALVDLIPEDAWKAMIQREIKLWMEGETAKNNSYDSYNNRSAIEPGIRRIVRAELESMFAANVKALLASEDWAGVWQGGKNTVGPEIAKLITENAAEILSGMLKSSISQVVHQMQFGGGPR